jgi:hypothetical protein
MADVNANKQQPARLEAQQELPMCPGLVFINTFDPLLGMNTFPLFFGSTKTSLLPSLPWKPNSQPPIARWLLPRHFFSKGTCEINNLYFRLRERTRSRNKI